MIAGYHLIWTAYGWWLPNDPRGSNSHSIRNPAIAELGDLHPGRKKLQPAGWVIKEFYASAKASLKHDLLTFSEREIAVLGESFGEVMRRRMYTCYAAAIMPDHVHLLIRKHRDSAETMIAELQEASRVAILEAGDRPASHPVWGGAGWKVFLETIDDMRRVVRYIDENPVKIGRPRQAWDFVTVYDGWLPGQAARRPAKPQARGRAGR